MTMTPQNTVDAYIRRQPTQSNRQIAKHVGVSHETIRKRRKALGLKAPPLRGHPISDAVIAHLIELTTADPDITNYAIADALGIHPETVIRYRKVFNRKSTWGQRSAAIRILLDAGLPLHEIVLQTGASRSLVDSVTHDWRQEQKS